jgi:capsular polysaccharide biosynthesis protein
METKDGQARGWEEGPDLLQSAWRYKWLIAVAALLGALLGYGWAARQPTLYAAASQVLLTGTPSLSLSGDAPPQPVGDPERYLRNQATLIGTTDVLERAAKKSKGEATVEDLRAAMVVEPEQDADLMTISILDESASRAATLANAIAEGYESFVEGQPGQLANQLRARRAQLEARLDQVNAELAAAPNDTSLERRRDALVDELKQLEKDLVRVEASVGTNLVNVESAVPPEQPAQPAPRRTMAVGLLVGLLASVALAWWLNARRAPQETRMPLEWSGPRGALPASGGDLGRERQDRAAPAESMVLAGRRPDGLASENGGRGHSAIARLMWRIMRRGQMSEPTTLDQARASSGAFQGGVSENGGEPSLSHLFVHLDRTLAKEPLEYYSEALPQAIAEEIPTDVSADTVIVLLDDGEGSFRVEGSVGLAADEREAVVDQGHEQLRQALWNGVSVLYGADALRAAAGIPGSQTQEALLIMPLVQGQTWLGALLIGRRAAPGRHATPFSDKEIADALLCSMELAALIQALLLSKRLRDCMGAFDPSGDVGPERGSEAPSPARARGHHRR